MPVFVNTCLGTLVQKSEIKDKVDNVVNADFVRTEKIFFVVPI